MTENEICHQRASGGAQTNNMLLRDRSADATVSPPELLADGYRRYERYSVTLQSSDDIPQRLSRDVLRGGNVIGVLPIDLVNNEIVLIRQFRLAGHLANGNGDMVEIVAGGIGTGEIAEAAARRECVEEIGTAPSRLIRMFELLTTPGITDETCTLFLGLIDATQVPARTGLASEMEDIRPFRITIPEALAELRDYKIGNSLAILSLQWLAMNLDRLDGLADE